jgi:thiamine biosynthesis protein ThiS
MLRLTVNGEPHELQGVRTIAELLAVMNVSPGLLVVERNGEVIDPQYYARTALAEGDSIELVRWVGGG